MYEEINKIVTELGKNKVVEKIVYTINRNENIDNLNDLIQDIYYQLLTKNTKKTIELYNKGQLNFFITRIVMNNICSTTSPYHRTYRQRIGDNFESLSFTEYNNIKEDNIWSKM